MALYDDYFRNEDKPFAENLNDALLLSNVFDLTVDIEAPKMFSNSTWVNSTSTRKCGVSLLTLKEGLPTGVTVETDSETGESVLTGTGTVKLSIYPNFNSFGKYESFTWENTGSIVVNLKTTAGTTIASNISKGVIQSQSTELRTLQEIVVEIVFTNATLKSFGFVMANKQQTRYGATVGIDDVTGLDDRLTAIETFDDSIFDIVYPVGSIYMSVNDVDPSALFGGTWEQLEDCFLLASGSNYDVGATGGSATVSLTEAEMPRHTHIQNSHNHTQNSHYHRPSDTSKKFLVSDADIVINPNKRAYTSQNSSGVHYLVTTDDRNGVGEVNTESTIATNQSATATNKYAGGTGSSESASTGSPHSNMPPYLTVNVWKRTA